MKNSAQKALREPQESFAALAVALPPQWHQAVLRLAKATERLTAQLEEWNGMRLDRRAAPHARELIEDLILFLDGLDPDPDLEPTAGGTLDDECEPEETEPSLGSFDRMMNQTLSWRDCGFLDLELDNCDREDDDPDEDKQQAPEMCPCA